MGKLFVIPGAVLIFIATLLSCSGEPPEKPVKQIELTHYEHNMGTWSYSTNKIKITSGNGDYSVVYPKFITVDDEEVAYSEYCGSLVSLSIDESDNIVVDFKTDDRQVFGMFMVKDAGGARRAFYLPCCDRTDYDSLRLSQSE